jgi:hypothetical protein
VPEQKTEAAINRIVVPATPALDLSRPLKQAQAIVEIEQRGGKLEYDFQRPDKPVVAVRLGGAKDLDVALEFVGDFPQLRSVDLSVAKGAECVTDAALVHLSEMDRLQHLNLSNTRIGDEGLEHLQALASLRSLDLRDTLVTDHGLKSLRGLTTLQNLSLWGNHVTDAGLANLRGLTALEDLNLGSTRVTAASLDTLKDLTNLKHLDLRNSKVNDAGYDAIKKALPKAQIDFDKLGADTREKQP